MAGLHARWGWSHFAAPTKSNHMTFPARFRVSSVWLNSASLCCPRAAKLRRHPLKSELNFPTGPKSPAPRSEDYTSWFKLIHIWFCFHELCKDSECVGLHVHHVPLFLSVRYLCHASNLIGLIHHAPERWRPNLRHLCSESTRGCNLCISDYHLIISIISVSFCIRSKNSPFAFNAFAKLTICEGKKRVGLPLHVLDGFFAAEDAARTPAQPSVYSYGWLGLWWDAKWPKPFWNGKGVCDGLWWSMTHPPNVDLVHFPGIALRLSWKSLTQHGKFCRPSRRLSDILFRGYCMKHRSPQKDTEVKHHRNSDLVGNYFSVFTG